MAERREKPFNIFQKVAIKKTRCEYIWEKSTFQKLRFFYIFSTRNHRRENSPNSIFCFVLFLHLVVKPLGMNFIIFPLIFIPKWRPCVLHTNLNNNRTPAITIIGAPFTVLTSGVLSLSGDVFERRTSTGSEPFSLLICLGANKFVLLSVFTLKETICPNICSKSRLKSAKGSLSVWRASFKNVAASGSPENNDRKWKFTSHESNFQHHFVCLFFARRPGQNCARVSQAMAQLFRWNQSHNWKNQKVFSCVLPPLL